MKRRFLFSLGLIFGMSLTVFPQAQTQAPSVVADDTPVLTVPKEYRYNSRGRRDPFVNPVPKPKGTAAAALEPPRPPGLKGVAVREALIAGVVTSKEPAMNVVIISAPGAKAPYFAHVGDELYDAVVKSIKLDTVTFALTATASAGDPTTPREIVRKVRPTPGENNK